MNADEYLSSSLGKVTIYVENHLRFSATVVSGSKRENLSQATTISVTGTLTFSFSEKGLKL